MWHKNLIFDSNFDDDILGEDMAMIKTATAKPDLEVCPSGLNEGCLMIMIMVMITMIVTMEMIMLIKTATAAAEPDLEVGPSRVD